VIVLTGSTGFIGRHVLDQLLISGEKVCVLLRQRQERFPKQVEQIVLDLMDYSKVTSSFKELGARKLIHLAWYAEHGKYWESEKNLAWVMASLNLIQSFVEAGGKKVVVAGSSAEYDWDYGYCREDETPLDPRTLYGISKQSTFNVLARYCMNKAVDLAWGRIFIPYGTGECEARLIPSLIRSLKNEDEPFSVNLRAYRDFLRVEDTARAIIHLLSPDAKGAYNISSGTPLRLLEVLRMIGSGLDSDISGYLAMERISSDEPLLLVGENQKLRALGWKPDYDFAAGLEELL